MISAMIIVCKYSRRLCLDIQWKNKYWQVLGVRPRPSQLWGWHQVRISIYLQLQCTVMDHARHCSFGWNCFLLRPVCLNRCLGVFGMFIGLIAGCPCHTYIFPFSLSSSFIWGLKVIGKFSIRTVPDQEPEQIVSLTEDYLKKLWRGRGSPNKMSVRGEGERGWLADTSTVNFKAASRFGDV